MVVASVTAKDERAIKENRDKYSILKRIVRDHAGETLLWKIRMQTQAY